MENSKLNFTKHAKARIHQRFGVWAETFVYYVRYTPECTVVIFDGKLPGRTVKSCTSKRRVTLIEPTHDIHILVKYESQYAILIVDKATSAVITVLSEEFYRRKSWAVMVTDVQKVHIDNALRGKVNAIGKSNNLSPINVYKEIDGIPDTLGKSQHVLQIGDSYYRFKDKELGKLTNTRSIAKIVQRLALKFSNVNIKSTDAMVLTTYKKQAILISTSAFINFITER